MEMWDNRSYIRIYRSSVRKQVICQKFCYNSREGETQSGKNLAQEKKLVEINKES